MFYSVTVIPPVDPDEIRATLGRFQSYEGLRWSKIRKSKVASKWAPRSRKWPEWKEPQPRSGYRLSELVNGTRMGDELREAALEMHRQHQAHREVTTPSGRRQSGGGWE